MYNGWSLNLECRSGNSDTEKGRLPPTGEPPGEVVAGPVTIMYHGTLREAVQCQERFTLNTTSADRGFEIMQPYPVTNWPNRSFLQLCMRLHPVQLCMRLRPKEC